MKRCIITTDALKPALAKLSQAVNAKSILPALQNILFKISPGKAELIASDTELTIFYSVECEAKESFEFLLPYDRLNVIVNLNKHCPLTIDAGATKVKVTGPNDGYDFKVEKVEDFPKLPELPKKNSVQIGTDVLDCLHIATTTTGKNDDRPAQQHVLLELKPNTITVASTDGGYVVFYKEFKHEQQEDEELLLSLKVIKALEGYSEASLYYHSKTIAFQSGDITIINTKSTHKFPAYRSVFPAEWPANLKLNKSDLLQALDRCALARDQLKQATINLENKQEFELSARDEIINVNVKIGGNYTGDVKSTSVNSEKLLKLINQVDVEEISFAIHDANKAIVLSTEEEGYRGLIMPIADTK